MILNQSLRKRTIKVPKIGKIEIGDLIFSLNDTLCLTNKDILVVVDYTEDGSINLSMEDFLELRNSGKIKDEFLEIGYLENDINFNIGTMKLNYFIPERMVLGNDELDKIQKAIEFKRAGKYKQANDIYEYYCKTYGTSIALYRSMAKNSACWMKYDEAIQMFKLANIEFFIECGDFDEDILHHLGIIQNRDKISKKDFLNYMKILSGNKNYTFPIES